MAFCDMLSVCQGHRKESEKSRSRKEGEATEGSPPKKSLKKAGNLMSFSLASYSHPQNYIPASVKPSDDGFLWSLEAYLWSFGIGQWSFLALSSSN